MNLDPIKRVGYGLLGIALSVAAVAGLFGLYMFMQLMGVLGDGASSLPQSPMVDFVLLGFPGGLFLYLMAKHTLLLMAPRRNGPLFLIAAASLLPLAALEAMSATPSYGFGHVILLAVGFLAVHDWWRCRRRVKHLTALGMTAR